MKFAGKLSCKVAD